MVKKLLIVALVLTLGLFVFNLTRNGTIPLPSSLAPPAAAPVVSVDTGSKDLTPYPMKKNGVHSIEDVLALIRLGWYPDLKGEALHEVVVSKDFWAYSQYFKNEKMYWSKRRTLVKAGTILYCNPDESKCVNSVCANELSLIPQTPVEEIVGFGVSHSQWPSLIPQTPVEEIPGTPLLNWTPDVPETLTPPDETTTPGEAPPSTDVPPGESCCGGGPGGGGPGGGGPGGGGPGGGGPGGGSPPTSVPEPAVVFLLAAGVGLIVLFRRLRSEL